MLKNKKGFTLIELLVVIAIISLLMAILMPALAGARKAATNVVCLSNLNQVAKSAHLYAADHGDKLPHDTGNGNNPWRSTLVSDSGKAAGEHYVSNVKHINGWGALYAYGYSKQAKIYYCPFNTGSDSFADIMRYWGPVGDGLPEWRTITKWDGNRQFARTGYMLNPYMIQKYSNPEQISTIMTSKLPSVVDLLPSKRVLAMDILSPIHKHLDPVWNVATFDGAVNSYKNSDVRTLMQIASNNPEDSWTLFDQYLGMIVLGRK